jgi:hypothetical protein
MEINPMALTHGRYYQQSIWLGGNGRPRRYRTQYWGQTYEWLQEQHAAERQAREEARREARRLEAEQRAAYHTEEAFGRLLDDAVAYALGRAGYSRISRGPWRRRAPVKGIDAPEMTPEVLAEIKVAAKAARSGEKADLVKLRELGRLYPDAVIEATVGDPAELAKMAIFEQYRNAPAAGEGIDLKLVRLAEELAGPDPTPARKLCAQVASYAHCEYWLIQMAATQHDWTSPYQVRRLDSAQSRYLKAIKTLAAVTRLERAKLPVVRATQVNINVTPPPEPETTALPDF